MRVEESLEYLETCEPRNSIESSRKYYAFLFAFVLDLNRLWYFLRVRTLVQAILSFYRTMVFECKSRRRRRTNPHQNTLRMYRWECEACPALFEDCVRAWPDWKFELIVDAARKLKILSAHVRDHLDGKLPRANDVATLARWDHEDAGERDGVQVGKFWYDLNHSTDKERLKRLRKFDDASKHALEYLETCVFREDGYAYMNTAHDARKLKIFSAHVRDHLDGKLPRLRDVATLARWDHEDDGERDGVPVGLWWYDLNRSKCEDRLKRLRNFDEDSNNALEYLERCEPRKDKTQGRNAK